MPKIIDILPFSPKQGRYSHAPLPKDQPCPFATIRVFASHARLIIDTKKPMLWVSMPYEGYILNFTVTPELYPCLGWNRREEDFTITISDGTYTCEFVIPGLGQA